MFLFKIINLLGVMLIYSGCAYSGFAQQQNVNSKMTSQQKAPIKAKSTLWKNIYKGDATLAGVDVEQYPEGAVLESKDRYTNKHPAVIFYFFWDGRVRQIGYNPDGSVTEDFWWPDKVQPGEDWWKDVDFSYGSDPEFKTHKDPRKKSGADR